MDEALCQAVAAEPDPKERNAALSIWLRQQGDAEAGSVAEAKAAALIARATALIEQRWPRPVPTAAQPHQHYRRKIKQPYRED